MADTPCCLCLREGSDPTCGQLRASGQSRSPPREVATLGARGRRDRRASPWPWKRRLHSGEVRRHREAQTRPGVSSPRRALYRLPQGSLGAGHHPGLPCDGTTQPARGEQTSVLGWGAFPGSQTQWSMSRMRSKCLLRVAGWSSFNTLPEQRVDKRFWLQIQFQYWLCQLTTYMVLYQVTEVNLSLICEKRMITLKSIAFNLRAVNKMVCVRHSSRC